MFEFYKIETNPEVVVKKPVKDIYSYTTGFVRGEFFRVIPDGFREIFLIQMLEMHQEKFAPANGNGILISKAAFQKLTA